MQRRHDLVDGPSSRLGNNGIMLVQLVGAAGYALFFRHQGCCGWAMSGMEVKIFQCKVPFCSNLLPSKDEVKPGVLFEPQDNDINKKVEAPHAEDIFNAKEEEQVKSRKYFKTGVDIFNANLAGRNLLSWSTHHVGLHGKSHSRKRPRTRD